MKALKGISLLTAFVLVCASLLLYINPARVASAATACTTSSPSSGSYTVTVCFSSPASGSTLSGVAPVSLSVTISGTTPGIQHATFNLNGQYLLMDYSSPYAFNLPTTRWVDGNYDLQATLLMRDGFATSQVVDSVTFNNGITTTPVNTNHFTPTSGTAPAAGSPFIVAAIGDGASGEANSSKVVSLVGSVNPNLFLYLGDTYEKGSPVEFYNWYGNSGSYFNRFHAITDPTVGNHEYLSSSSAAGYFDYWNNIPNYYSFDAGGWHFISLNSNLSKLGSTVVSAQSTWLSQDLAAHSGACAIVFYHHPVYNVGPEGSATTMASIWSTLAQYHVTLVLNGHDHDYQRWVPLDGSGNPNPNGVTEFVAGGGGHGIQKITNTDSRVAYDNSSNPAAFGVLRLSLTSSAANFAYLSINGTTLDSGTVGCK